MQCTSWKLLAVSLCACGVMALLVPGEMAPQALAQKKKKDPDLTRYLKQLHAKFDAWDKNSDNVLDKAELAKAFRGSSAKPYDYEAADTTPATKKVKPVSVILATLPLPSLPTHLAAAELLAETPKPKKTTPTVNINTLADYQFIVIAGNKGKDKISKQEFDSWANKYARLVDDHEDAERQIKDAKARFAKAKTPQAKKQADLDLQRHLQEFQNAHRQLQAIPLAIHKTLNIIKL